MIRDYNFWVYIVTNRNHSVLYMGVTNRLSRRTWEHREGKQQRICGDLSMHEADLLRGYRNIRDATAREGQLKKWSRAEKMTLINRLNPSWGDLGADMLQER